MVKTLVSLVLYPVSALSFFVVAVTFLIITAIFPPRRVYWAVRILARTFLFLSGQILITEGKAPEKKKGPYLYLFNHGSLFDVFMLASGIRHYITSVGKASQFDYPVWGTVIKRYGVIPIQRKNLKKAIHSLALLEEAIRNGVSSIISPEGTRTLTGELQPFKKGPFHVAINTGVTLVPVGLIGAFDAKKKTDWRIRPGILKIRFGKPITGDEYKNETVESLSLRLRDEISNLLK